MSLADWSVPSCRSTESGSATFCSRKAEQKLPIPNDESSWTSTDKIFVFVDPQRAPELSKDRGRVPATVSVQMDGTLDGEARVEVEAIYERAMEPLLKRANVGWMAAGLRDRGIGIYVSRENLERRALSLEVSSADPSYTIPVLPHQTWPLPPHLQAGPSSIYHYAPLSFKVTIHLQPNASVPNVRIEGTEIHASVFSKLIGKPFHPTVTSGDNTDTTSAPVTSSSSVTGRDSNRRGLEEREKVATRVNAMEKSFRLGHAMGKAHSSQRDLDVRETSSSAATAQPTDTAPLQHPYLGSLVIKTGRGSLALGGSVETMGRTKLETGEGQIAVMDGSQLLSREIHLESHRGDVFVGKNVTGYSSDIIYIAARHGDLWVGENTLLHGTRINGEAKGGSLDGPHSVWASNHTMVLRGEKGIKAQAAVSPPFPPVLGVGTEQRPWVKVDADSSEGNVALQIVNQTAQLPLRITAKASKGSIDLALNREFTGEFEVSGAKRESRIVAPAAASKEDESAGRERVYSMKDTSGDNAQSQLKAQGEIWWKGAGITTKPTGEDWGSVRVSAQRSAQVSFDA